MTFNFVTINPFQVENLPSTFFLNRPTPVGHSVLRSLHVQGSCCNVELKQLPLFVLHVLLDDSSVWQEHVE